MSWSSLTKTTRSRKYDFMASNDLALRESRYKIGDSFFSLPVTEVQELLSQSTENIENHVEKLESQLGHLREEMQELKVALYSRFGRSINLEV